MSRFHRLHLLFTSIASVAALSDCYLPNGTALPLSAAYEPCIATENVFSMCCVLNVTALVALGLSAASLDTCLPNGMCQPPSSTGGFTRDLCTDPTWKSPNCLNVCVGGADGGSSSDTSFLTQCSDGSYCCGSKNTACCNDKQGFQVADEIHPYASTVSSSVGTSSSLTGTSASSTSKSSGSSETGTSSPQTSQSSTNAPVKGTSTNGAEIGLGAALGVILVAVIAVGIFFWMKKRGVHSGRVELASDSKSSYPMLPVHQQGNGYAEQHKAYQAPLPQSPIQQNGGMHEITSEPEYAPGGAYAVEMDGNGGKKVAL